jgi:signal transduction histidine kinase
VGSDTRPASLVAIHEIARAAQEAQDADRLLARVCECVAETFGFERVAIARHVEETDDLEVVAAHGMPLDALRRLPREQRDRTYMRRAFDERQLVFVENVGDDPRADPKVVEAFRLRSILALPLVAAGRCLGALAADRGGGRFLLDDDDLELLETIGTLAATFLEKALVHDELLRLDRLKSNFIALASHELRTPVAVVSGIAATLHLRGNELREDQLDALRAALYEQSERTRELVDQLLDLSRLEARSIQIRPERLSVRSRLEEIVLLVAQERASDVRIEVAPDLQAVVDPSTLDRVVSNLVLNALRYGDAPIMVSAEQRDRHFRLSVEDRGRGVPADFVPRLFERFSRGADSVTIASGAGLGLSIAQSYAHAHGGELLYEPAQPRGARFELVLPRAPA